MKIALIANPQSGGKKGKKLLPHVQKKLIQQNIKFDTFQSLYHEHIFKIVKNLELKKYDAVVAMGGDGTNFHVLNGLLKNFDLSMIPPIGVLPVGSGNSFAKDLKINTIEDGIRSLIEKSTRRVDVLSFTQSDELFYFINLTGLGFVTDVAKTAHKFKFLKDLSYIIGVLHRTTRLFYHYIELEVDGKLISEQNCFVEFCNSRYTGGNMLMAPDALIDDGYMDIIIAGPLSRFSLLATLPKIFSGLHLEHPSVRHIKARKAKIKTWPPKTLLPDGEIFGVTPATIEVHPKLVRYYC